MSAAGLCLKEHGMVGIFIRYQPGSRYWAFQWIEAAIFVGLALMLLLAVFRLASRRLR